MDIEEGKQKFIEAWGKMAGDWGINKTMAQVHALLLIAPEAKCADEVMDELDCCRGNVNMNLRALVEWGLVHKTQQPGDRKEYFLAEKDMWVVVRQIIIHRKKKELEPMIQVLDEVSNVSPTCPASAAFVQTVRDLKVFSHKANRTLDTLVQTNTGWFTNIFMTMVK